MVLSIENPHRIHIRVRSNSTHGLVQSQQIIIESLKNSSYEILGSEKSFNISVDVIKIPLVQHTKFLGIRLDNELKWTTDVNNVINKLQSNKRLLSLPEQDPFEEHLLWTHSKYGSTITNQRDLQASEILHSYY